MSRKPRGRGRGDGEVAFRAGCGRERGGPADLPELAYRELAYPECPTCVHRLEPDDAPPFCRWRPAGAPHPFAGLAGLRDALGEGREGERPEGSPGGEDAA